MKNLSLTETAEFLRCHDNYLLLSHRRPDGDTVGSCAALCLALRKLGKQAFLYENPQFTPKFAPYFTGLTADTVPEHATVLSVDVAAEGLFPFGMEQAQVALAIDHHGTNTGFAEFVCVDASAAACGEIIWALLPLLDVQPDQKIAEAVYAAVSTDTGCFRYSNTTANTLSVAAACKACGADTYSINCVMFEIKRKARLQLEAYLIDTMEFYAGGSVSINAMPTEVLNKLGITEDDITDISGFGRNVEGVEIAVMLREVEDGVGKVSVRTSPRYDAAKICARFGGGGHAAAAGGSVPGGIAAAKAAALASVAQELPITELY